jgi:hypothetical protein
LQFESGRDLTRSPLLKSAAIMWSILLTCEKLVSVAWSLDRMPIDPKNVGFILHCPKCEDYFVRTYLMIRKSISKALLIFCLKAHRFSLLQAHQWYSKVSVVFHFQNYSFKKIWVILSKIAPLHFPGAVPLKRSNISAKTSKM